MTGFDNFFSQISSFPLSNCKEHAANGLANVSMMDLWQIGSIKPSIADDGGVDLISCQHYCLF
jgi:hypothetical protein